MVLQSRDRHPRLFAKAQPRRSLPKPLKRWECCLTGCHIRVNGRTDEGVCPYRLAFIWIERTIQISFREALLSLGEAGWGFHPRVSVPTLKTHHQRTGAFLHCQERLPSKQRNALLVSTERPLHIEESVPLFLVLLLLLTRHCLTTPRLYTTL